MRNSVISLTDFATTTIASGQSLSTAVDLGGLRLFGIVMPAAWTTAALTFQMSPDGGATYNNMFDDSGAEFLIQSDVSRYIMLDPVAFAPVQWLKLRSGPAAAAVAQSASRTIKLVLRGV